MIIENEALLSEREQTIAEKEAQLAEGDRVIAVRDAELEEGVPERKSIQTIIGACLECQADVDRAAMLTWR
jgi:hypothetical protein